MVYFNRPIFLKKMTKTRKFCLGDFVKYAGKEWVVTKKTKTRGETAYRLVRRQVNTGEAIVVPKKRLKHADQTWRKLLMPGDPLELFLGGQWTSAAVFRRDENMLTVQPSFSNFTMKVSQDSGIIERGTHAYPLWEKDEVRPVLYGSQCRIQRGDNLLFPWTYTDPDVVVTGVTGPLTTSLVTITYPFYQPDGFQLKMYKNLTKREIISDVLSNPGGHPLLLQLVASQYHSCRLATYTFLQNAGIQYYITEALAHEDDRRVQELLSVGDKDSLFHKNEWLVREHLAHPYIDFNVELRDKKLHFEILFSGMQTDKICASVSEILEIISTPMRYAPKKIAVDATPELQYLLSRMLGMEQEPVETLGARKVGKSILTLTRGICDLPMKLCGGQLNVECVNYPTLVNELMRRSPIKTLVVVEKNALPIWKDFNVYYGRTRKVEELTVTTKTLFSRLKTTAFASVERLFVVVDTGWFSSFAWEAKHFECKVKWAAGVGPTWRNSRIFWNDEKNDKLCISLTKEKMQNMGVEFPQVTHQPVVFNVNKESTENFLKHMDVTHPPPTNPLARGWRMSHCSQQLSLYLEHPELVPLDYRGEKLAAVEATAKNISEKFKIPETVLDSRSQETCSVCLEKITDAAVTPCGHVFCCQCMVELHKRKINCPMCRSKITSFLKLSDKDTTGKVTVVRGIPYRIPENEQWGKKIEFLKQHKDSTIVTGSDSVGKALKRKLQKTFRKRQIVTTEEIRQHQHPVSSKIILMKPSRAFQDFGLPWGKNLEVLELKYEVKEIPFGKKYY